jgi:hypothetical protein
MSTPHYINENESDMRGIKPGWYAMDGHGKLSSGPFFKREECLSTGNQRTNVTTEIAEPLKACVTKAFNRRIA